MITLLIITNKMVLVGMIIVIDYEIEHHPYYW